MSSALDETRQFSRKLPRISLKVNGKAIHALVDAGASMNFIRADVLEEMDLSNLPGPTVIQLGCRDNTSHILEYAEVQIELAGMPFLTEQDVTIDVTRKCLYVGKNPRQTLFWKIAVERRLAKIELPEFEEHQFSPETKNVVLSIIREFPDVFEETLKQPVTQASVHEIKVKEEKPFRRFRYDKLSEARKNIVHEEIQKLLEAGVIVASDSPYCSPVVFVPKKDGKLRFCVDYREINKLVGSYPYIINCYLENSKIL